MKYVLWLQVSTSSRARSNTGADDRVVTLLEPVNAKAHVPPASTYVVPPTPFPPAATAEDESPPGTPDRPSAMVFPGTSSPGQPPQSHALSREPPRFFHHPQIPIEKHYDSATGSTHFGVKSRVCVE